LIINTNSLQWLEEIGETMKTEQQQLWVILLIVFIGFIGTSIAYPIFPPLFLHPAYGAIVPVSWHANARSIFLGIALAAYPLGQFIGSPILGSCSDRYSRKIILMISLAGSAIGYLLSALSIQWNALWLLLASRFLTGLMEGNLAIVRAMAMELTSMSKFKSLGRINGMCAIGYVMGPLLGGYLSDKHLVSWFSFAFPFFLATVFAILAMLLAAFKLTEKQRETIPTEISIWQRFNLIKRFKLLFKSNPALKYLFIVGTLFTFSADIFYEFGPVYLTGLWGMTPADIAVYNGILSVALGIGSVWLPHHLAQYFSIKRIVAVGMLITAMIFILLTIFPSPIFAFVLFGLSGLSIATVNTNMTVQISNTAHQTIQGEAIGTQLSLRMLGDALICLTGGFLILSSFTLPLALSCLFALGAVSVYLTYKKE
jgi:DHA1 family tetracycline resistance protein-like MFS transporter